VRPAGMQGVRAAGLTRHSSRRPHRPCFCSFSEGMTAAEPRLNFVVRRSFLEDTMRVTNTNNGLRVHAIAGTYVVILGFDLPQADCDGLLGFSIHRSDHTEGEAYFLEATNAFAETD